jgi:general secretion pathway protein D
MVALNSSANQPPVAAAAPVRQPVPVQSPGPMQPPGPARTAGVQAPFSWQGPGQARVGERISLTLNTQAQQGVGNLSFLVGFDPAVLKAVDVVEGELAKQNNAPSNFTKAIDQQGGQLLIDLAGMGAESGSGSVATLVFEVTGTSPQSPVAVSRIVATGTAGEPVALAAPVPHTIAVAP